MKKYTFLVLCCILGVFSACQDDDEAGNVGYLSLSIDTNTTVNTQSRAFDATSYDATQIAVQIIDANGAVVVEADDYTTLDSEITLSTGVYTVNAFSNGFDGSSAGFSAPYYTGSTSVTIKKDTKTTATIECTLANVKVTVNFDESMEAFASAISTVSSAVSNVDSLDFEMGTTTESGYFPVGDLTARLKVTNTAGSYYELPTTIEDVEARDHYTINYSVDDTEYGDATINVVVNGDETVYSYTFTVSTTATTQLAVRSANAWSKFAYVEGYVVSSDSELTASNMEFQYRLASSTDDDDWTSVTATYSANDDIYTAKITDLTNSTEYSYRMAYITDDGTYYSGTTTFTTEDATELINGDMDDWYTDSKTVYPISETYYTTNGGSFWDTSNPGAAALLSVNTTTESTDVVHTTGGSAAALQSKYIVIKFAAASLYTGSFNSLVGTKGAKIDFGQSFTDRPTQFHGYFQYSTSTVDYVGSDTPESANMTKGETLDLCSIYIALATQSYTVDNTDSDTFIDFENDENIIAYGALPDSKCVSTNGEWAEFTIDLEYRDITTKPSYIIIVCSSSKYGDYFTGSTSSLLYLDDMELVYGDDPVIAE